MSLGRSIRRRRMELGLRGIDLARTSGLSSSFLSQIEKDRTSPSVSTLKRIAEALNTSVASFFESAFSDEEQGEELQHQSPVVRESERKVLSLGEGVNFFLLNQNLNEGVKLILNILSPGATTSKELYSHQGEEAGLVLEGELEIQLGNRKYHLQSGDSISFKSTIPHRKTNTGQSKSISVWGNTMVPF